MSRRAAGLAAVLLGSGSLAWGFLFTAPSGLKLFSTLFGGGGGTPVAGGGFTMTSTIGGNSPAPLAGPTFSVNGSITSTSRPSQATVEAAHAFPVPFRPDRGHAKITFTRLTAQATIRVYSISGRLVRTLSKTDPSTDSLAWDATNDGGQPLASGLYLFFVEGGGTTKKGKLVVIR